MGAMKRLLMEKQERQTETEEVAEVFIEFHFPIGEFWSGEYSSKNNFRSLTRLEQTRPGFLMKWQKEQMSHI